MIRSSRRQGCVSTVYCLSVAIGGRAWDNFKYFLPKVATPDDYIRNNVIRYIDDYKGNRLNYVLRFIEGMSAADLDGGTELGFSILVFDISLRGTTRVLSASTMNIHLVPRRDYPEFLFEDIAPQRIEFLIHLTRQCNFRFLYVLVLPEMFHVMFFHMFSHVIGYVFGSALEIDTHFKDTSNYIVVTNVKVVATCI